MTDEHINTSTPAEPIATPDETRTELELAQAKAEEYLAGWQRAKADYLNFKRDTEKQWTEMIQYSNTALIAELLPIFRHFKLAWKHVPAEAQSQAWLQGFDHIRRQLEDFLKKFGIEEIKTVGEKFNPEFHEAVTREKKDGVAPDTVIEELQPGYVLNGKVVEPARVKVSE